MCNQMIVMSSVTYAIKGRDILKTKGYRVAIDRLPPGPQRPGCGYGVCVTGDLNSAVAVLQQNGVKIVDVIRR